MGTHRAPGKGKEISEADMHQIREALEERFVQSSDIANDLRYVSAKAKIMFAAVESSIDSEYETARQESGARVVQEAIQLAWDELPFKEEYPTTWLRFEAFLNHKHNSRILKLDVIQQAAKHYGIGEDDEREIHDALGFFHDIGAIVYLSKYINYVCMCICVYVCTNLADVSVVFQASSHHCTLRKRIKQFLISEFFLIPLGSLRS